MSIRPQYIASLVTGGVFAIALMAILYSGQRGTEASTPSSAVAVRSSGNDTGGQLAELPAEFDMGVISNKTKTVKTLTLKNEGTGDLAIRDIRTSCGCTSGYFVDPKSREEMRTATIGPGETVELSISVDPFRVPGFDTRKSMTLFTNDSESSTATFDVVAKVDPEFAVEPEEINFGNLKKGEKAAQTVVIRQLQDGPFDVKSVRVGGLAPDAYTAELSKRPEAEWTTPGKPEWTVAVVLDTSALQRSRFRDRIYIETTSERVRQFACVLEAKINSFYKIIPELIHRRDAVEPGSQSIGSAVVTADQPFTIEDIKLSDPGLTVVVKQEDAPDAAVLDVSVAADATPGVKNGLLTFTVAGADGTRAVHSMRAIVAVKEAP